MREDIVKLKATFANPLPGRVAHDKVMSNARPSVSEILASGKKPRRSAVTFLLYPKNTSWCFLLLKRHDYEGVHSGQVGLPGGSLDLGETERQAAIRELQEESGLRIETEQVVAKLSPLYIPPSNFIVQPYAAIVAEEPIWSFDPAEVKRGMQIPLYDLLLDDSLKETTVTMSGGKARLQVKAFVFMGETVWGATAMILSECKDLLRNFAT